MVTAPDSVVPTAARASCRALPETTSRNGGLGGKAPLRYPLTARWPVSQATSSEEPESNKEEPPVQTDWLPSARRRPALERLGLIQALGGLAKA